MAAFDPLTYDLSNLPINEAFRNVETIIPLPPNSVPPAVWRDENFGQSLMWSGVPLDENQIITIGETWLANIVTGNISSQTAIKGLRLAMSIMSMSRGDMKHLFVPQVRFEAAGVNLLPASPLPAIDQFASTPFTLRAQQIVQATTAPAMAFGAQTNNNAPADDVKKRQISYCFLAAFLMKLLAKAPDNTVSGINNMKVRFESFYGSTRIVSGFTMTMEQATAYKAALESHARIGLTYTHAIANTHQNRVEALDPKELRVLSYLCFHPFSYAGMHAYTLMIELSQFKKVSLDKLLTLFYADITAPALKEIHTIVERFERTVAAPDRSVLFRYCTLWGPQYFQPVRSKQCPHLLFVVVTAWKTIAPGHENSDPEKIVALRGLSQSMKNTLRRAGEAAGNILKRNTC